METTTQNNRLQRLEPPPSLKSSILEREAVGACLLLNDSIRTALDAGLNADCFAYPTHRRLFERLRELYLAGEEINPATVYAKLDTPLLESLGGMHGLYELETAAGTGMLVGSTVAKLLALAERRRTWIAFTEMQLGLETGMEVTEAYAPVRKLLNERAAARSCRVSTAQEAAREAIGTLEKAMQCSGLCGVTTGYPTLDTLTGGLQPGGFYVLGARPGVGKTAFALHSALAAARSGTRVLFATAEMTAGQLAERSIAMTAGVSLAPFRTPGVQPSKSYLRAVLNAVKELQKPPLCYLESLERSAEDVADTIRAEHRRQKLGLIVLDYLQHLRSDSVRAQASEVDNINAVSLLFSGLARELGVPVVALAQLNRDCSKSKRPPQAADLKGSSQIEQDADMVCLLHRPEMDLPYDAGEEEREKVRGKVNLFVVKNRNGRLCSISMFFNGESLLFRELPQG